MNFKFPNKRLAARLMAVTAITLATASCSWLESLDKDPTADWSADKLYTEARAALEESNWTDAKTITPKLEARYPFGTYAQQAQIELIYANWKDGDAAQAVQGADRFPAGLSEHANSDYVMYLKALATLNENDGWFLRSSPRRTLPSATPMPPKKPSTSSRSSPCASPDSRYAPEARRRMHQLVLAQAKHELGVAEYYYVRHAYVAAIQHAQRVVSEFQNTPMRDDALEIIANSYDKLEMHDLAADTRRVLELNKGQDRQGPPLSRALISARKEEAS